LKWTRARILKKISQDHGVKSDKAVPEDLRLAARLEFGSYQAAANVALREGNKVRRYSDKELFSWLRLQATTFPQMTLVELTKRRQFAVLRSRFGTWNQAVKVAGIKNWPMVAKPRWTRERIIREMRVLATQGKSVSDDENLYAAAKRHFGSLAAAATLAGVKVRQPKAPISAKKVIAGLRKLALTTDQVTTKLGRAAGLKHAAEVHFGTFSAACDAAGVVGYAANLSKQHAALEQPKLLIKQLRSIAARLPHSVTRRDLPWNLSEALLRAFGSLDAAREHANLPHPTLKHRWTKPLIIKELRREHRKGTRLTRNGLKAAGRGDLLSACPVYFDTFVAARQAAGVGHPAALPLAHIPFHKIWDDARVIDEILARDAEGLSLAASAVPRPLMAAACRYCTNWRSAVAAAGFDYDQVSLRQEISDEQLMDRLRELALSDPNAAPSDLRWLSITAIVNRRFGGYVKAAARAKIKDWPQRKALPALQPAELQQLLTTRLRHNKSLERYEVLRDHPRVGFAMQRVHPSWQQALKRLGLR
jgi:hypothetical protein